MNKKIILKDFSLKLCQTLLITFVIIPLVVFFVVFSKKEMLDIIKREKNSTSPNEDNGSCTGYIWLIHNTPEDLISKVPGIKLATIKYMLTDPFEFWTDENYEPIWR